MQLQDWADAEVAALDGVLTAAAALLDSLPTANDPADRAAIVTEFDATVLRLREDLARSSAQDADAAIAGALVYVIDLLRSELAGDRAVR